LPEAVPRIGSLLATSLEPRIGRASYITTELALRWATLPEKAQPSTWVWRLGMVRRFAKWNQAVDPRTEVPPETILCHRYQRKTPHFYSDQEISRLLRGAEQLPSSNGLRARTYSTLFGLLAVSGMRTNEAVSLDRQDVDLHQGILTIRRTKFGKSRHVPVHLSTVQALKKYADNRDRIFATPRTPAFFISDRGTRITDCIVQVRHGRNWVNVDRGVIVRRLALRSSASAA
jgi:integrase/recombinase XerD